jgi:hypothetical protein
MVNQKGQAFSVFELMIAAIVAIAILFVLLPLVAPPEIGGNATTEIGTTLTDKEGGGFARTQEFTLTPNELISSSNFDEQGFDATQIVFHGGEFEGGKVTSGLQGDIISYIQSDSKTPTKAKAMVYCSATGASLLNEVGLIVEGDGDDISTALGKVKADITTLCVGNNAQPCCAVVLVRR